MSRSSTQRDCYFYVLVRSCHAQSAVNLSSPEFALTFNVSLFADSHIELSFAGSFTSWPWSPQVGNGADNLSPQHVGAGTVPAPEQGSAGTWLCNDGMGTFVSVGPTMLTFACGQELQHSVCRGDG